MACEFLVAVKSYAKLLYTVYFTLLYFTILRTPYGGEVIITKLPGSNQTKRATTPSQVFVGGSR